ncbi:hypothetical protein PWT90_09557 [Aphanocladium album]|nr:hypothetical protein PWT90_09557 [Aphanocladium album]
MHLGDANVPDGIRNGSIGCTRNVPYPDGAAELVDGCRRHGAEEERNGVDAAVADEYDALDVVGEHGAQLPRKTLRPGGEGMILGGGAAAGLTHSDSCRVRSRVKMRRHRRGTGHDEEKKKKNGEKMGKGKVTESEKATAVR